MVPTALTALSASRSALMRALVFASPLIGILFTDKALKLAAAGRIDNIAPLPRTLVPLLAMLLQYRPLVLCLAVFAIGLSLSMLLGRSAGRTGRLVGWLLAVPIGIATTALEIALEARFSSIDASGWHSAMDELRDFPALWWREGLIAVIAVTGLGLHFASAARKPAPIRSVMVGACLFISCVIVGIDFAFFVLTNAQLTDADVAYAFSAPGEAWFVAHGTITPLACAPLIVCLSALITVYALSRYRRPPKQPPLPGRGVHVGLIVASATFLSFAAPALPTDLSLESYVGSPLVQLTVGPIWSSIKRRFFASAAGAVSGRVPDLSSAAVVAVETPRTRPLNVVVVMLESVRADATTLYTPNLPTTPFLVELAKESLVVDDMYAVIPRTSAAWVAILAGRYPGTREVVKDYASRTPVAPLVSSLPAILRARGYASAFITPTSMTYENDSEVIGALGFQKVVIAKDIPAPVSGSVTPFGWEDRAALEPIRRWLDERTQHGGPFLLAVMTNVGHYPYGLPGDYPTRHYPSRTPEHDSYLNCVHYIDDYLRELVGLLRSRNLLESTLLIVLGDHGEEFQEHGGIVHGFALYDEVLHIPMLMRLPQADAQRGHIKGLRQQIDVLPTIVESLGLRLQGPPMAGRSLLSSPGHEALFFGTHLERSFLALREGSYKYLYDLSRDSIKVFDLKQDPGEHNDVRSNIPMSALSQTEVDLLAWHQRVTQTYLGPAGSH
jgi:arylsulfatase A-like enzyme